jgi:hypothetical protein
MEGTVTEAAHVTEVRDEIRRARRLLQRLP